MGSHHEITAGKEITIEGLPIALMICGCILFLIQNLSFCFSIYNLPLDILGALLLSISLLLLFIRKKMVILLAAGILLVGWMVCTIAWRFSIYQNPEILERNIYGHLNVIMTFGISAIMFFIGFFLFLRIILLSEQFGTFINKRKKLAKNYVKAVLLYLLLHLSFSFGIIIGGLDPVLLIMLEMGLFFKLFIVPVFGVFVFGGTTYLLVMRNK